MPYSIGATKQRWLVPRGRITITARQTFEMLKPWASGWRNHEVASETLDVKRALHRIALKIPAPPSDAELLKR